MRYRPCQRGSAQCSGAPWPNPHMPGREGAWTTCCSRRTGAASPGKRYVWMDGLNKPGHMRRCSLGTKVGQPTAMKCSWAERLCCRARGLTLWPLAYVLLVERVAGTSCHLSPAITIGRPIRQSCKSFRGVKAAHLSMPYMFADLVNGLTILLSAIWNMLTMAEAC